MESLLAFAHDLERRDAELARSLDQVERLAREVDDMRAAGAATVAFLASLPAARAERAADERAALDAREQAAAAVRDADAAVAAARRDDERLAAERAALEARGALHAADRLAADAVSALAALEQEAGERRTEAERLESRAAALGPRVRDVPVPAGGLDGAVEWASRARGALLLERSALAGERELIVREASELLGSVLGEALAVTGVAGVRDRLERALGGT